MDDQAHNTPGAQSARIPVVLAIRAPAREAGVGSGGATGTAVTMSFALSSDA